MWADAAQIHRNGPHWSTTIIVIHNIYIIYEYVTEIDRYAYISSTINS